MSRKKTRWGHIEELSENKHRIWWKGGHRPDGKRKQPSKIIYGTWEDAELELAKIFIQQGGQKPDMTYEELWGGIIEPSFEKRQLAVRTIQGNRRIWKKELEPRIAKDIVCETTPRRVESILAEIESAWVQRSTFSLWRKMINLAIHEGIDMRNPCDRYICRKKTVPSQKPLLEAHEILSWMKTIEGLKSEISLLVLAGGGMRVEEGCALLVDDIEWIEISNRIYALASLNKALVSTNHGRILKGMKTDDRFAIRTVAIGEPFSIRIKELMPESGALCQSGRCDDVHSPMHFSNPTTMSRHYKTRCESRGFKYVNPGKLRKSWSVMQGEAGSPDSIVSLAMGHSDGTTRGRNYQQLTRKAALGLADALTSLIEEF